VPNFNAGSQIPISQLEYLERTIDERRIADGMAAIHNLYNEVLPNLSPRLGNASRFLADLTIFVDTGYGGVGNLQHAFGHFGQVERSTVSAEDLAYYRFALAVYSFLTGKAALAKECMWRAIEEMGDDKAGAFFRNLALFYQARMARKSGAYEAAEDKTREAEQMAESRSKPLLAAVIRSTRAWVLWEKGDPQAQTILNDCRRVLEPTDDEAGKIAITSMLGRIARRRGMYPESVVYADEVVCRADAFCPEHPSYPRYLINAAAAKRLLAREIERELEREIDEEQQVRGNVRHFLNQHKMFVVKSGDAAYAEIAEAPGVQKFLAYHTAWKTRQEQQTARSRCRAEIAALRNETERLLAKAREIESTLPNHHGLGLVDFYTGLLRLDQQRPLEALACGKSALEAGVRCRNPVLRARAFVLQCLAAKACADENLASELYPGYY